jgi:Zn finger protein HypA/HybF involved in hydrogenase expression
MKSTMEDLSIKCQHCHHTWLRRTISPRECPNCKRRIEQEGNDVSTPVGSNATGRK